MGLICNRFSKISKVLKNLCKHSLSIRNHTFLVRDESVTTTLEKYKPVVMSIQIC